MSVQQTTSDKRTILLAEDDVLIRMPLGEFLRGCGYKVLEVRSADEAILVLDDGTAPVDLVVSNIVLAGNGFGIARWIRDNQPGLEFHLTGTTKRAVEVAASLCADGPLPAPYNAQILQRRIHRLLANRRRPPHQAKRVASASK